MCFSSAASFTTATLLTGAGILTVRATSDKSQIPFACIPFLFGTQQFIEGVLWITIGNPEHATITRWATISFLVFAQVIWPFWVPFSVWKFERPELRSNALHVLLGTGFLLALFLAGCLLRYPVSARIESHHIQYYLSYSSLVLPVSGVFYIAATVFPPFLSRQPKMKILGGIILASYALTMALFDAYLISVWCFFAAVLSVFVYLVIKEVPRVPVAENILKASSR